MNDIIKNSETVVISPPNFREAIFSIKGTSPLVINKFSRKAMEQMQAAQAAGSQAKSKKKREPKDFEALAAAAAYRSEKGWYGMNAASWRLALIGACRLVGFKMTLAKLSVFIVEEGHDVEDGTPLVRILGGKPRTDVRPARNDNGSVDLRPRPMWTEWGCKLRVRWDADQFSLQDITNLLMRVGLQCGMGEGRAASTQSAGLGWGHFTVEQEDKAKEKV